MAWKQDFSNLDDRAERRLEEVLAQSPVSSVVADSTTKQILGDLRALHHAGKGMHRPIIAHVPGSIRFGNQRHLIAHFVSFAEPKFKGEWGRIECRAAGATWRSRLALTGTEMKFVLAYTGRQPSEQSFYLANRVRWREPWKGEPELLFARSVERDSIAVYLPRRLPSYFTVFQCGRELGSAWWRHQAGDVPATTPLVTWFKILTGQLRLRDFLTFHGPVVKIEDPALTRPENWVLTFSLAIMLGHSVWPKLS